jgi:Do/DeqQ family serine protease
MKNNIKKYAAFLVVASLGGLVALGISRLLSKDESAKFEQNYLAKYASLTEGIDRPDFVQVAELVTPTVVHILTVVEAQPQADNRQQQMDPFDFFKGHGFDLQMPNQGPRAGSGSGVIISQDGYIITNNHVIDGANKIKVVLNDKREYDATLIGKDKNTDLALLRIDEKNLPFAVIGNSDDVKVGQWVLAVGNPFNLTSTVTAGIVSAKGRNLNLLRNGGANYSIESFIQTDAAVNPGNSGGALVSSDGKLVGINTAIASETGQYAGYAFAIPTNLMKKVMDDLLKYGEVQRGVLGVEIRDVDGELADKEGLKEIKGIFIAKVRENSAAEDGGLKEKDVIIGLDGQNVKSTPELQEMIGKRNPGDKVKVTVLRDGKEKDCIVTLKSLDGKTNISTVEKIDVNKVIDTEFETLPREERLKLKIANGIKIKKVGTKSPMKKAGVPDGFVVTQIDKKPVATINDVKSSLENKKGGVLLEGINPDGSKGFYGFGLEK